jgi:adenine-specific DNA-methyltransferase
MQDWEDEIWNIPNVKSNHPEKTNHPCQFPIELVERCVLALTNKNSWILDPYVGTGSTIIAALKNNRNVIGVDKELSYVNITKDRVKKLANGKLNVRPINKPVHIPKPTDKVAQIPDGWYTKKNSSI